MSDQHAIHKAPNSQADTLDAFIAKYVRSYEVEKDDYDRSPFAADIKEGKNDPVYNAHSYHTKVPPRSIVPYILHYTNPGDVVLDPFCGSGMTGVAARMCVEPPPDILELFPELKDRVGPRACILNDLSSAACHISYNYNTPVDTNKLKAEFERIERQAKDEILSLYRTEHYEPAIGDYDLRSSDVTDRLKNPTEGKTRFHLLQEDEEERTWQLLTRSEVEERLGYPVTQLPRRHDWDETDLEKSENWVCIPATIQYAIWSDVYRCEGLVSVEEPTGKTSTRGKNAGKPITRTTRVARGCGSEIVLKYASLIHGHDDRQGSTFTCPKCKTEWQKSQLAWIRSEPVESGVSWTDSAGKWHNYLRPITDSEKKLAKKEPREGDWFPSDKLYANRELLTMGAGKRGIERVSDFYFPRQLRTLAILFSWIDRINDERTKKAALFAFTAIALKCSRLNRLRPSGAGDPLTGTLYIGSLIREENTWEAWQRRVEVLLVGFANIRTDRVIVNRGDASKLEGIPDSSIDFIFADPPFGGNIFYADASLLWEGWLRTYTDVSAEMVMHRRSKSARQADGYVFKELDDYSQDMRNAFKHMFRVLKPGRWAVVEFNNSDGAVFEAIKQGATNEGFEIVNMLLLDKEQKSFKQVQGVLGKEEVVDKDVLFNLHKPSNVLPEAQAQQHDLEQQVSQAVREHLQTLPERIKADPARYNDEHRTTATINSMLMNTLIPRGVSVERLNLPFIERVCGRYFRKIGQHWYLRGESVGARNSKALIEEDVKITDEISAIEWLRQEIRQRPMLIGEIKPLWMRATGLLPIAISQYLDLDELLCENFWRDPESNRWREPTEEEREKINDDRSIRALHDAERYVAGSLHRTTTDTERCEWIDVLFKACRQVEDGDMQSTPALRGFNSDDGYRLITRLFQTVLRDNVPADRYARAQKQDIAASNRISQSIRDEEELRKADRARLKGPTLFDGID